MMRPSRRLLLDAFALSLMLLAVGAPVALAGGFTSAGGGSAPTNAQVSAVAAPLIVTGTTDTRQVKIVGNSTQTTPPLDVQNSAGVSQFNVTNAGAGTFAGSVTSASLVTAGSQGFDLGSVSGTLKNQSNGNILLQFLGSGNPSAILQSETTDGATAIGIKLNNFTALSNAAAKLLSVQNGGVEKAYTMFDGSLGSKSTKTSGQITLAAGSGTATVLSGAMCVCTDATANASVKCAVATTTLTATGTGTDVITYLCMGQ